MIAKIQTKAGQLRFTVLNDLEAYRAESLFTKEPETTTWIETFNDGDVFYDVGANVGVYSLYAALLYPRSSVFSFEPFHRNYGHLVENILENQLANVNPVNVALSESTGLTTLFVPDTRFGASGGQIGEPVNERGERFEALAAVPTLCFRLDDLRQSAGLPFPHHVKIDVDGLEAAIIAGMSSFLFEPTLRSVLVEVNSEEDAEIIDAVLGEHGFSRDAEIGQLPQHSRHRRKLTPGNIAENVVFRR